MSETLSEPKRVLLIISGGIAAYKSLELIRTLRREGVAVRCVMTKAAEEFVTPLSVAALSEDKVYTDLFSLTDEAEMGHIQLSRSADLLAVAPATADILARMAHGNANDIATTVLLATDKPVMAAPAMNVRMWDHPATQANIATLKQRGVEMIGPVEGDMACGEFGYGRMSEPAEIASAILSRLHAATGAQAKPLAGRSAIVTSGPTHEPIDPVRYIANRSSGRQGHAIAEALAQAGAAVTLVSGPTRLADPAGVETVHVETAQQMLDACLTALPADIAVCAAAVADWRVSGKADQKLKKDSGSLPSLALTENPDILATLSKTGSTRPALVVGFAAETEAVLEHAMAKRKRKGCDWILANDVSEGTGTFGGDRNRIHFIDENGHQDWPDSTKVEVATTLTEKIAAHFAGTTT
ncbi:bifunctional phosphopantothenoylcysteine decarboxylase/phosphopantothenate--cysteine ligase CoaBC [Hwanghaeella grinnelliae]|uniref:Coenzyme A biosynthesis bifunctional protein CoaBC n=1 Tax=Hwanghaeella grinnelliae TaxID=2500179 RepID=A0A3S2VPR1_9PROT|nr:bifunctional phosphopantothenoylcysteine decarboxylase/phosphopantothenate--cysteine ligase CoaBC [Hwanghaeella grinnelliae]RVU36075.1 bifunctional phosphopantothenoylcysteine decarboxylase/phosphopantothenate--cysteine ligase CoaBC [Hwanghaeella grinnelliae]